MKRCRGEDGKWPRQIQMQKFRNCDLDTQLRFLADGLYDPDATNTRGETMLHALADKPDKVVLVKALVEQGASVDYLDEHGHTPME